MATEQEIIFKIDAQPTITALKDIGKSIDEAKVALQGYAKGTDEYIKQEAVIKGLQKEQRSLTNVLVQQQAGLKSLTASVESNIKTGNANKNSIDENRKAYNALYNQLIRTKEPSDEMIKTVKTLSNTLKEQEAALGNTSRNVGNYGQGFDQLTGKLMDTIPAMNSVKAAQQGINMIMSANPIGGIITLLFSLKDILGGNAEVADQFAFVMAGVNKVVEVAVDMAVEAIKQFEFLGNAFEDPIGTIKQLGDIIANNLLNRLKALGGLIEAAALAFSGQWSKAAEKAANSALQFTTGVEGMATTLGTTAKEGYNAADALDALQKVIGQTEIAIEKNNQAIEREKVILMNKKKSDAERKKAAEEIIRLEEENSKKRISIAQQELHIEKEKLKGRTLSSEQELKLLRMEAKVEKETADAIAATRKARIEIDKILYGEDAKNKEQAGKSAEELAMKEEEALKKGQADAMRYQKEEQAIRDKRQKAIDDARVKEFNDAVSFSQRKLELDKQAVDLSVGTEQEKLAQKQQLQLAYLQEQLDITEEYFGADGLLTEVEIQGLQKIRNEIMLTQKQMEDGVKAPQGLGLDKETAQEMTESIGVITEGLDLVFAGIAQSNQNQIAAIENQKQADIDRINSTVGNEETKAAEIKKIEVKAAKDRYEIDKKQFEANKAAQISKAIADAALAAIATFAVPDFSFGILTAIRLGLITATLGTTLGTIAGQQPPPPPKFAKGVIGLEGAGTGTSDSIDAKLSKGESVITAKATERFAPLLAQMEMAVGNRPNFQLGSKRFATGYIPTTDGGYFARNAGKEITQSDAIANSMENAVSKLPPPVLQYEEFTGFVNGVDRSTTLTEL